MRSLGAPRVLLRLVYHRNKSGCILFTTSPRRRQGECSRRRQAP
jgi:hypothetical protein